MKEFKTYKEQVQILKDRGMSFKDEDSAMYFLQAENYYDVVNGYKEPFLLLDNENKPINPEQYKPGTTFEQIKALYLLNRDLRSIFLRSSIIFESYLKSILAYEFCDKYREANAYLDINSYYHSDISRIEKQIDIMNTIIEDKSRHEGPIKHYVDEHEVVPFWVLVKYLTMGNISYLFDILDTQTKNNIAKRFSQRFNKEYEMRDNDRIVLSAEDLQGVIKVINITRNMCAHGERIYNQNFGNVRFRNIKNYFGINCPNDRLCMVMIAFKVLLTKKYFLSFLDEFKNCLGCYEQSISSKEYDKVKYAMGIYANNLIEKLS